MAKTEKVIKLPEGITDEQIAAWKAKYNGKVKLIEIYKQGSFDPFRFIARAPDRKITSEYFKWMDKNFDKASDILITNCCLSGAEELKADEELFITAATQLAELLPIGRGEIKNL